MPDAGMKALSAALTSMSASEAQPTAPRTQHVSIRQGVIPANAIGATQVNAMSILPQDLDKAAKNSFRMRIFAQVLQGCNPSSYSFT